MEICGPQADNGVESNEGEGQSSKNQKESDRKGQQGRVITGLGTNSSVGIRLTPSSFFSNTHCARKGTTIILINNYILKIPSAGRKYKTFSSCGSHLIVVFLFYGTGLGVYLSSAVTHSSRKSAIVSVMYTVVTPMMNPFIYSLRNKDMMGALSKIISRISSFH